MPLIWLIEDNAAFREATQMALQVQPAGYQSECFESCERALARLEDGIKPDLIFLDVGLPGMDGITGIQHFKAKLPETGIVILTMFEEDDKIFRAICAGASGYLLKGESLTNIGMAIEQAMAGGSPMNPQVARRVLAMFSKLVPVKKDYGLTEREQNVLELMVEGKAKKQIADELGISVHTVNSYVRIVYKKLHVNCQTAAVSIALRDGLIGGLE
jgi:DNA-binding NarL/FixJ family response regulator